MSVRITRSSIALGLCLLSGCLAISESTIRTGTPEEARTTLSEMLNETSMSPGSYLTDGVKNLVRVMNNKSLTSSGSGNYPEQARLEALRQLIAYSRTSKANTPVGSSQKIPAKGIHGAFVYTYNKTATDAMKREILRFFDTPAMYPELISQSNLVDKFGKADWTPTRTPVYASDSDYYYSSTASAVFDPPTSAWKEVFDACPSQAQWGALFDKVAVPFAQEFEQGETLYLRYIHRGGYHQKKEFIWRQVGEVYSKIKQPTYNQKKIALILCHPEKFIPDYQHVSGGAYLKTMPEYQAYINTITEYQKKALNSMSKSEVLKVLKELDLLVQKNTQKAYYCLYSWIWLERVATPQQKEAFVAQELNKVQQYNQQKMDANRKELLALRARQDRETVGVQCKYCGCGWMTNRTKAMGWQQERRINDLGDVEPYHMDDNEYLIRFGTWCDCPHARSDHRIISK